MFGDFFEAMTVAPGNPSSTGFGDLFSIFFLLAIADLALRGVALWRSAREGKNWWFVALLIVNSLGILPLIFLVFFANKNKDHQAGSQNIPQAPKRKKAVSARSKK